MVKVNYLFIKVIFKSLNVSIHLSLKIDYTVFNNRKWHPKIFRHIYIVNYTEILKFELKSIIISRKVVLTD